MSSIREEMLALLMPLNLVHFDFEDQSHLHIGHAGVREGGHFAILVVSEAFAPMSRVMRQRQIQTLLKPLFQNKKIHALSIIAKTPSEYFY